MPKTIDSIADLQPDPRNANKGTERGAYMVARSLEEYGAGRSILADADGVVIAGNKTLQAAVDLGIPVRVVQTDGHELVVVQRTDLSLMDDDQRARLLAYADNRASEVGLEWDAGEIAFDLSAGLDLSGLFYENELDELISDIANGGEPQEDPGAQIDETAELKLNEFMELREKWGVVFGQIWRAGEHWVMCGDSTNKDDLDALFSLSEKPQHLIYDPDWDAELVVPDFEWRSVIAYADGYRARDVIRKFGLPAWVFAWDGCTSWYTPNRPLRRAKLALWFGNIEDYNFDGAHYGDAGEERDVSNSRGSYTFKPDPRGKHLSDVFQKPLPQLHSEGFHPYEKPIDWVRLLIGNCFPGDVCDLFLGCGNSLLACNQLGKRCVGVEIEPLYVAYLLEKCDLLGLSPRMETEIV